MANPHQAFNMGLNYVKEELIKRGFEVNEIKEGNTAFSKCLSVKFNEDIIIIKTKTKRSGTWQLSTNDMVKDAQESDYPNRFWVFVDFEDRKIPLVYIMPEYWIRDCMYLIYSQHLVRHGGRRPVTEDSPHIGLRERFIKNWRGKWEILFKE